MTDQKVSLTRQWLPNLVPAAAAGSMPITVLSYNILAPCNITHTQQLYKQPEDLDWSKRLSMIRTEIAHINADILCLQEADNEDYKKLVLSEYDYVYARRPANKEPEGQMILWRKSMFKLVESHDLVLNFDKQNSLYRNNQVCPIVVLRLLAKSTQCTYFIVANAHINYNVERGDKKLAQVHLISSAMSQIQRYLSQLGNKTVCIFCGDFNSTPSSAVFKLLTKGTYDCRTLPLSRISGQSETDIPKEGLSHKWYNETMNKVSHWSPDKPLPLETIDRLALWYMTIVNSYIDYDIMKRSLIAKYKLELPLIYSFYERRYVLSPVEKRRLREVFCNSMEEVEQLEAAGPSSALLTYVLESPMVFKNAYSEVLRNVVDYVRSYTAKHTGQLAYDRIEDKEKVKELVGRTFNDVELNYEDWGQTEKLLEGHTYESGFSHWVDRVLKCDYIFFNGPGFVPLKVYELPSYRHVVDLGGICPNAFVPSDHMPVAALFNYTPQHDE